MLNCYTLFTLLLLYFTYHEETRELPGERDNARNNATHGLDGQHKFVDRTPRGFLEEQSESLRIEMEDRDEWRKYVYGVANPRIEDG